MFSFSVPAAAGGAGGGGDGAGEEGAGEEAPAGPSLGEEPSESAPVEVQASASSGMTSEETLGHEVRCKLRRFVMASKSWSDLGVGNLCVLLPAAGAAAAGGKRCARVTFSAPSAVRPLFRGQLDAAGARAEELPAKADGSAGGISLLVLTVVGDKQELVKLMVTVKGLPAQQQALKAIQEAIAVSK
jgi:hypothetical protein